MKGQKNAPEEKIEDSMIKLLRKPTQASLRVKARNYMFTYLKRIIPFLYQTRASIYRRLYVEFYRNHRYLRPKSIHEDNKFKCREEMSSIVWVGQLLVVQAVVFYCLVLLHLQQYPVDDGTCAMHSTQGACENKHSRFDTDKEICSWQPDTVIEVMDYFPCKYVLPVVTFRSIFLFSAVAAILSAILNFFVDIVANNILLCETSVDKRRSNVVDIEELHISEASAQRHDVDFYSMIKLQLKKFSLKNSFDQALESAMKVGNINCRQNAVDSVREVWNETSDMIENGFCNKLFIPEILMLNAGMIRLALSSLNVASSVIGNGNEANDFFEFMYCIKQQRRKYADDPVALRLFDREWGLNGDGKGEFIYSQRGITCSDETILFKDDRVDRLIHKEHVSVTQKFKSEQDLLSILRDEIDPTAFDSIAGIRIIYQFIVDLIGRHNASAIMFEERSKQE
jgi:hypothetical protein